MASKRKRVSQDDGDRLVMLERKLRKHQDDTTKRRKYEKKIEELKFGKKKKEEEEAQVREGEAESEPKISLFVGNLPYKVEEENLRSIFEPCGGILDIRFGHDEAGEFRRYAHIDFATKEALRNALELHGTKVMNKSISVEEALGTSSKQSKFVRPEEPVANTDKIIRCFVGNLPLLIDEAALFEAFEAENIRASQVAWVTDRQSGNFYGSSFVVFSTSEDAAWAVAFSQSNWEIQGRPIRIEFCPHRGTRSRPSKAQARLQAPISTRPDGGTNTAFFGNLPFDIDVEGEDLRAFCKDFGKIQTIRWVEDKKTGEFKGAGFAEFDTEQAVDELVNKMNGEKLKGRPIRIDYA